MGGKTTVEAPKPSAAETALQNEQVTLLRQQRETTQQMMHQQDLMAPLMYKQMGITPQYDSEGKITGYTETPKEQMTPEQLQRQSQQDAFMQLQTKSLEQSLAQLNDPTSKQITDMLQQRTLSALKGDLPIDPTLERTLKEQRTTLEDTLRSNIGSGYATSTPGIQAMADFDKRAAELRSSAQTGQLTLAEQLSQAREARGSNTMQQSLPGTELSDRLRSSTLGSIMGINQQGWQGPQMMGNVAQGYNAPMSWYAGQRQQQLQAGISNAQTGGGMAGAFGSLLGTGITAAAIY